MPKQCCTCREVKDLGDFYKKSNRCKSCARAYNKAYAEAKKRSYVPTIGLKTCARCGVTKPTSDFVVARRAAGGLHSYCRGCLYEASNACRTKRLQPKRDAAKARIASNEAVLCSVCGCVRQVGKRCTSCVGSKNERYYEAHRYELLDKQKLRDFRYREAALNAYGGLCACCGEDNYEFLAIDHIEGGGVKQRKELFGSNSSSTRFYRWLAQQGFSSGYRVLCHNCNMALGSYGYCPHQSKQLEVSA